MFVFELFLFKNIIITVCHFDFKIKWIYEKISINDILTLNCGG